MVGGAMAACVVAIGILFGLVNSVSHGYEDILAGTVRQGDDARMMQVAFKKQVQEWKDILLRGYNPADLQKYSLQFTDQERLVQDLTAKLDTSVTDATISDEIQRFRDQHSALSAKYRTAYDAFVASRGTDFKTADAAVKGLDRAPTDLIDKIVSGLDAQRRRLIAEQQQQVANDQIAIVAIGSALVLGVLAGLHLASRDIVRPVRDARAVLGAVAAGNLTVSMAGAYGGEFGAIKESINTAVSDLNTGLTRVVAGADRIAETSRFVESVGDQLLQSAQITRVSLDVIEQTVRDIDTVSGPARLAHQIDEVRHALHTMAAITDRNVMAAEDASRATHELRSNSNNLQRVVAAYKLRSNAELVTRVIGRHSPVKAIAAAPVARPGKP
jgi:methyl-accepting chemotaxis protein